MRGKGPRRGALGGALGEEEGAASFSSFSLLTSDPWKPAAPSLGHMWTCGHVWSPWILLVLTGFNLLTGRRSMWMDVAHPQVSRSRCCVVSGGLQAVLVSALTTVGAPKTTVLE